MAKTNVISMMEEISLGDLESVGSWRGKDARDSVTSFGISLSTRQLGSLVLVGGFPTLITASSLGKLSLRNQTFREAIILPFSRSLR